MPRTVVYRAGGFTNCGIGYTKFSQEELAERRDRAMTENEALEALKLEGGLEITGRPIRVAQFFEGIEVAIKALEEVRQYRSSGTPEECRAAVNKQDPKKPIYAGFLRGGYWCLYCNEIVRRSDCYCSNCGQKLDWRDEE